MKSMLRRTTFREIKQSLGRYLAIFSIVALGVGFFAGLLVTKPAMVETGNRYLDELQFFDYQLLNNYGFEEEDVAAVEAREDVRAAEGAVSTDAICLYENGTESVLGIHSMTEEVNQLSLTEGRLPSAADECVVDARMGEVEIGDTVRISEQNEEDTKEMFSYQEYTVVGKVNSPLYLNFERGSTGLLNGKKTGFLYLLLEGFDCDYFTEIYVRFLHDPSIYTEEYTDYIEKKESEFEALGEEIAKRRYDSIFEKAQEEIDKNQKELDDKVAEAEEELADAWKEIEDGEKELEDAFRQLDDNEKTLQSNKQKVQDGLSQIASSKQQLEAYGMTEGAEWQQLLLTEQGLIQNLEALEAGEKELRQKRREAEDAQKELEEGRAEYEEGKAELEEEVSDANEKLKDAREELAELDEPEAYLLGRNTNVGYVLFENDVQIVEGVAKVFPVFFFLIAALVCVTTMNRMVEEQRTQIGVLKALGYSRKSIMNKYMFYAGSAAIGGAILGFFAGSYVFPLVIWKAYNIMYGFSKEIVFLLDIPLAVISFLVALLCSVGATYISCRHELNSVAAELMRPKAPKNGKRIFLERIGFIWKRMKFLHKVSVRNVFRYKKRFFMMILGISGCTALLVAGFGIKNSISNLVPEQYGEIQLYDILVTFDKELSKVEEEQFAESITDIAQDSFYVKEESVDLENEDIVKSVTLVVPREEEDFEKFICLKDEKEQKIPYPQKGEVVLTHKVAKKLGVKAGDTIVLRDTDRTATTLTISGITVNYAYSYAYISKESYTEGFEKEIEFTSCFVNLTDKDNYNDANVKISELSFVISSSANQTFAERFDGMMTSLDAIVVLIILCAAALAFIVLYNLTNINITERIREIATIKVLGFYSNETASYVFRENIVLTGIGSLLGLILGKWLLQYVMYNIDVDAVAFKIYIHPFSYLISILLTFLFAAFVNWVMYFKLKKINMAESLKSIE